MQALNLHSEQMLSTVKENNYENTQGMSKSDQNESSFNIALEKAEKEIQPEKLHTTDGKNLDSQRIIDLSQLNDDVSLSDISDESFSWIVTDPELQAFQKDEKLEINNTLSQKEDEVISQINQLDQLILKSENTIANIKKVDNDKPNSLIESLEDNLADTKETNTKETTTKNQQEEDILLYSLLTGNNIITNENTTIDNKGDTSEINLDISKKTKSLGQKNEPVISVIDERTPVVSEKTKENFVTKIETTSENTVEMTMSLNSEKANNVKFEGTIQGNSQHSDFSTMLSNQIQENAGEFVKAGSLVLKDKNQGTINLVLHPDELGSVKIQLELSDKMISGKIVVATQEAFDSFKNSMNNLKEAFNSSGFQNTSFDLSWSGSDKNSENQNQQNFQGSKYFNNVPEVNEDNYGLMLAHDSVIYGSSLINIMA